MGNIISSCTIGLHFNTHIHLLIVNLYQTTLLAEFQLEFVA